MCICIQLQLPWNLFFYFGWPVLIYMTVGFTKNGTRVRFLSSEILILCTHMKPECGPHYLIHTGTYMLTHTWTHICRAHARRQAYTCRRICDYNQINWSISPWKHHIHTWRPLVAFSWMLLTLTRGQAAGSGSARSQRALWHQHLLTAYMFRKIITALFALTEEEFFYALLLRGSGVFKPL